MTLRCGILTLKTSDSFFRSFRFLRQNEAFSATEQNQTYKNSLSFTMVSLQFSKKFYYSGCLTSSLNPVKNKGIVQKYTISISNGNIQKKCVNPLDFNFLESHILLVHSTLSNCGFSIVRKKKKYHIPDAASERV